MRRLLPLAAMAIFFSCSKNDNPNELNATDKNFIIGTFLSNKAELRLSELAMYRSNSTGVKNFAQAVTENYSSAQQDLIDIAGKLNFSISDTVVVADQTVSEIEQLFGYSFDTAYINSRVKTHRSILDKYRSELNEGNNTYLRYYFLNKYLDKVKAFYLQADSISRNL